MFIADKWQDYQLIDASDGERLESWGGKLLVRPDPQVIWTSKQRSRLWDKADGVYARASSGGGSWVKKNIPEQWTIGYDDMKFIISPMGFKHTGLFPEQAANWEWFMPLIKSANRPIKVLNLFAYTGGASVAAAKAGAFVCHVDASKGMVARAKENAALSGVPADSIRFIVDDCIKFTQREIRRGSFYDAVILDPPSFGRGPKGEKWVLEESLDHLVATVADVLTPNPLFVLLNSYTTGLSASTTGYILHNNIASRFGGKIRSEELGLPVEQSGFPLPCGSSARFQL